MKQVAALPFSVSSSGEITVWLVTTRNGRHWIVPKGNVDIGLTPQEAVAQEAREEAGLVGTIAPEPVGRFVYRKQKAEGPLFIEIDLYPLQVDRQLKDWPEKGEREILRCSLTTALSLITVPGLGKLIQDFITARGTGVSPPAPHAAVLDRT